jgi:hypothetical protein
MGSKDRTGQPLASRERAVKGVWVDLRALFGSTSGDAEGIDLDAPGAGGLLEWIRLSDGGWAARVTYVVKMTDGSTRKFSDQVVPARALRPR